MGNIFFPMNGIVRYIVSTLLAVIGGWVGYYYIPTEPFGSAGNILFVSMVIGLFAGLIDATGFFGNIINVFIFTVPVYLLSSGGFAVMWLWSNLGYAVGNVFGQLTRLSVAGKIEARAL